MAIVNEEVDRLREISGLEVSDLLQKNILVLLYFTHILKLNNYAIKYLL